jgi:DNA-binding ferritin-like protein
MEKEEEEQATYCLVPDNETLEKIAMIKRQTNYGDSDDEHIAERLVALGGDPIKVIKEHLGIPIEKKRDPITSLNQEIYKQFREKLHIVGKQF